MKQPKRKKKKSSSLVVYETDNKGIFKDMQGRLFDRKGLAALRAHGVAVFEVVRKTEIQKGSNKNLTGRS